MKIGVVMMLVENRILNRAPTWSEIRDMALQSEDLGFDSIWVYDHLLYRDEKGTTTGIWESWSILTALAAVTRRVELGTLVACNSFRNPALMAKMAHTVDEICSGRLILGLGAGWNKPEYDAFGFPFDHRVDRLEEALQIIRPLLKEGRVDFQGKYYTARDCEITPRSPRAEGPPLMIGCGKARMLRLTARYADMWNVGYMSIPKSTETEFKAFRKACKEEGRDLSSIDASFMISLGYGDLADWKSDKKRGYLSGSEAEIAATLFEYEKLGVTHLMFHLTPSTPEAYQRLARAVDLYRRESVLRI
jgi:probable F420-dependent oxidoreductase